MNQQTYLDLHQLPGSEVGESHFLSSLNKFTLFQLILVKNIKIIKLILQWRTFKCKSFRNKDTMRAFLR